MTISENLNIIVIPIAVALLPLIWGLTGWMIKRSQFLELIFRELEEIGPYPPTRDPIHPKKDWTKHHNNKRFLHKEIIAEKATENREFILSLPADVIYYVTQLWNFQDESKQWLHMLSKLEAKIPFWQIRRRGRLTEVKRGWYVLMKEYGEVFDSKFEKDHRLEFSQLSLEQQERLNKISKNGS